MPIGTAGGPRRWSSGSNFTPQQPPRPLPGGRRVGERWNKRRNNGDEKTGFGKPPSLSLKINPLSQNFKRTTRCAAVATEARGVFVCCSVAST